MANFENNNTSFNGEDFDANMYFNIGLAGLGLDMGDTLSFDFNDYINADAGDEHEFDELFESTTSETTAENGTATANDAEHVDMAVAFNEENGVAAADNVIANNAQFNDMTLVDTEENGAATMTAADDNVDLTNTTMVSYEENGVATAEHSIVSNAQYADMSMVNNEEDGAASPNDAAVNAKHPDVAISNLEENTTAAVNDATVNHADPINMAMANNATFNFTDHTYMAIDDDTLQLQAALTLALSQTEQSHVPALTLPEHQAFDSPAFVNQTSSQSSGDQVWASPFAPQEVSQQINEQTFALTFPEQQASHVVTDQPIAQSVNEQQAFALTFPEQQVYYVVDDQTCAQPSNENFSASSSTHQEAVPAAQPVNQQQASGLTFPQPQASHFLADQTYAQSGAYQALTFPAHVTAEQIMAQPNSEHHTSQEARIVVDLTDDHPVDERRPSSKGKILAACKRFDQATTPIKPKRAIGTRNPRARTAKPTSKVKQAAIRQIDGPGSSPKPSLKSSPPMPFPEIDPSILNMDQFQQQQPGPEPDLPMLSGSEPDLPMLSGSEPVGAQMSFTDMLAPTSSSSAPKETSSGEDSAPNSQDSEGAPQPMDPQQAGEWLELGRSVRDLPRSQYTPGQYQNGIWQGYDAAVADLESRRRFSVEYLRRAGNLPAGEQNIVAEMISDAKLALEQYRRDYDAELQNRDFLKWVDFKDALLLEMESRLATSLHHRARLEREIAELREQLGDQAQARVHERVILARPARPDAPPFVSGMAQPARPLAPVRVANPAVAARPGKPAAAVVARDVVVARPLVGGVSEAGLPSLDEITSAPPGSKGRNRKRTSDGALSHAVAKRARTNAGGDDPHRTAPSPRRFFAKFFLGGELIQREIDPTVAQRQRIEEFSRRLGTLVPGLLDAVWPDNIEFRLDGEFMENLGRLCTAGVIPPELVTWAAAAEEATPHQQPRVAVADGARRAPATPRRQRGGRRSSNNTTAANAVVTAPTPRVWSGSAGSGPLPPHPEGEEGQETAVYDPTRPSESELLELKFKRLPDSMTPLLGLPAHLRQVSGEFAAADIAANYKLDDGGASFGGQQQMRQATGQMVMNNGQMRSQQQQHQQFGQQQQMPPPMMQEFGYPPPPPPWGGEGPGRM
ncbi:hypothetical protein V8F06_004112 [Rhypophila decipiens]